MPGHIKLGKSGEPDPDPAPYLVVSMEMKREDMLKPYDPKKSVWVPTEDHGFREGLLESDDGKKAVVLLGHEVRKIKIITKQVKVKSLTT
jgi:myosin heavy chain 6/7